MTIHNPKDEYVVLVNEDDQEVGTMEKMAAHEKGVLHRAFSVFVYNSEGNVLLQRRADHKYHSPGLWANTCCSHPRPGEQLADAASRRLREEMGMACSLASPFSFIYRAELDQGLIEHELDHVFVGTCDIVPIPNPDEVSEWRYCSPSDIRAEMDQFPERFSSWFLICFDQTIGHISELIEAGQATS